MSIDTINFLDQSGKLFLAFYNSGFVFWLKIFLAIYVSVMLVDIILVLILHTPGMYYRILKAGANVPLVDKDKTKKKWESIRERLRSGNESQFKVAILEADKLADEFLTKVGYPGNNMGERLDQISADQIEMIDDLKKAHEVRNQIVYDAKFNIDKKAAEETVAIYEKMLDTLEFI